MWTLPVPLWGRFFVAVTVEIVPTAVTVSKLRSMFATHGLPHILVSDSGAAFTSLEFKEFLKQNGIRHLTSAPYHPATNGMAGRYVQTFKVAPKKATRSDNDLQRELSRFLFRYRTTPHSTTGNTDGSPTQDTSRFSASRCGRLKAGKKSLMSHFRLFQTGDQVFIRNFVAGPKWQALS